MGVILALTFVSSVRYASKDRATPAQSSTTVYAPAESGRTDPPACSDVWKVGGALPPRYDGCVGDDGAIVSKAGYQCTDGSFLVVGPRDAGGRLFTATTGATIVVSAPADNDQVNACTH